MCSLTDFRLLQICVSSSGDDGVGDSPSGVTSPPSLFLSLSLSLSLSHTHTHTHTHTPIKPLYCVCCPLQCLSPKRLVSVCCECVEVMESGVVREDGEFGEGMPEDIVAEMNKIHQKIIQETGTIISRFSAHQLLEI